MARMSIEPLKFVPILKERLWGCDRLARLFDKTSGLAAGPIGESWELVDLPDDCSVVADGPLAGLSLRQVLTAHGESIGFTASQCNPPFGLLIKFLDAGQNLSVQVHPGQNACKLFPGARLKTECWYVLDAEDNSFIYRGLRPGTARRQLTDAIAAGTVEGLLERFEARKGDFHFLPAGTVHALGSGVLVAEIQTPSDTTFRLFDWNRRDSAGNARELHIDQALESIDLFGCNRPTDKNRCNGGDLLLDIASQLGPARLLADCEYFSVVHVKMPAGKAAFCRPFPVVMMILSGAGRLDSVERTHGNLRYEPADTILLPVCADQKCVIDADQPGEALLVCLGPETAM